jgi:hypothetical protein
VFRSVSDERRAEGEIAEAEIRRHFEQVLERQLRLDGARVMESSLRRYRRDQASRTFGADPSERSYSVKSWHYPPPRDASPF